MASSSERVEMEEGGMTEDPTDPETKLSRYYEQYASKPFALGQWVASDVANWIVAGAALFIAWRFLRRRSAQLVPRVALDLI